MKILHCTGCDETWTSRSHAVLGKPCPQSGTGEVRLATADEVEAYNARGVR